MTYGGELSNISPIFHPKKESMPVDRDVQQNKLVKEFQEAFPNGTGFYSWSELGWWLKKVEEAEKRGIELGREDMRSAAIGELSRSDLSAVADNLGRAHGHTHAAVHGVKNTLNAILVIAHRRQAMHIGLPMEKLITIEQIKDNKLRGNRRALVMDNYAITEFYRDLLERLKRALTHLNTEDKPKECDVRWTELSPRGTKMSIFCGHPLPCPHHNKKP